MTPGTLTGSGVQLPKALFFDLDDTLISCDSVSERAWDEVVADVSEGRVPGWAADLRAAIQETVAWYWKDPDRGRRGRMNLVLARQELVAGALEKLGISDPALADRMGARYTAIRDGYVHLLPGALNLLQCLEGEPIRRCLVTNGASRIQRAKIERFGLARFFDEVIIEEEVGFGKPDPRIFGEAMERVHVDAHEAWMVGDHLEYDIAGAQRCGLYAIWHDWRQVGLPPDAPTVPDRIIMSMAELHPV